MQKLLLATDLSGRSDVALGRAVQLAREQSAALLVAHVIDEDLPPPMAEVLEDEPRT